MFIRKDLVNEIIGIAIILVSFFTAFILMDYHRLTVNPLIQSEESISYEIHPGDSISTIANDFVARGWIPHPLYLKVYARLKELHEIKVGMYQIAPDATLGDVLNKFVTADVELETITFIEGWTTQQMLNAVKQHSSIKQTIAHLTSQQIMEKLGKPELHPEGQFLPDTYAFARGTLDINILSRAHQALNEALLENWSKRSEKLPLQSPYEALILASIIEKETGKAQERPLIAGVFTKRLKKGMKLQTDPTVIYGMGDNYKGNIRKKDLREDTPYNTYVHKGLTPTPISLAGKAAIHAATHPDEQGYLYFVAKGDGSHYFSKTLKEHNAAVRKYQLKK